MVITGKCCLEMSKVPQKFYPDRHCGVLTSWVATKQGEAIKERPSLSLEFKLRSITVSRTSLRT